MLMKTMVRNLGCASFTEHSTVAAGIALVRSWCAPSAALDSSTKTWATPWFTMYGHLTLLIAPMLVLIPRGAQVTVRVPRATAHGASLSASFCDMPEMLCSVVACQNISIPLKGTACMRLDL